MSKQMCVIYCRVSSRGQELNGNLERQVEYCSEYAQKHKYEIVKIFSEVASTNARQPERDKCVQFLEENPPNSQGWRIIIQTLDRWHRGSTDTPLFQIIEEALVEDSPDLKALQAKTNQRIKEIFDEYAKAIQVTPDKEKCGVEAQLATRRDNGKEVC